MKNSLKRNKVKGFTLIEVVVALALVALLLTGSLGLMAISATKIDRTLSRIEAEQITQTVIKKFDQMDFADAADIIGTTPTNNYETHTSADNVVFVYSYFGSLTDAPREYDGSPQVYSPINGDVLGVDYQRYSICRVRGFDYDSTGDGTKDSDEGDLMFTGSDAEIRSQFLSGPIYLIKFKPYHDSATGGNLGLQDYGDDTFAVDKNPDDNVSITFQMEVYKLPNSNFTVISSTGNEDLIDPENFRNERGAIRPVHRETFTINRQ